MKQKPVTQTGNTNDTLLAAGGTEEFGNQVFTRKKLDQVPETSGHDGKYKHLSCESDVCGCT